MAHSQLAHNTKLSIYEELEAKPRMNRIICTIGPKTQTVAALKDLMLAGMSVVRMNFSHGSYEFHQTTIDNARIAAKELGLHSVSIALDTKGPEIRTGLFTGDGAHLNAGDTCIITTQDEFKETGTKEKFYIDYKRLAQVVKVGGKIFIDDGVLDLTVIEIIDAENIRVEVRNTHLLTNRKGCNLPKAEVDLPAVSEKDKLDLEFAAKNEVDMIFASFIRSAEQVRQVRAALGARATKTLVISKIENHQGVDLLDEIIAESDGIMVARGDLGVEIPAEKVVIAQKMMIAKCNIAGKPVICATQMLESMTTNPRPTRAEVSDVANAVLDGADCVMLSGETAKGLYPTQVVQYMARICLEAQQAGRDSVMFTAIKGLQAIPMLPEESICSSAVNTVFELQAKLVVVLSNTGRSAKLIAKYRPPCPIVCASQMLDVCRSLSIVRGVFPVYYDIPTLGDDVARERRVRLAFKYAIEHLGVAAGSLAVVVHADQYTKGFANQTRVLRVPTLESLASLDPPALAE